MTGSSIIPVIIDEPSSNGTIPYIPPAPKDPYAIGFEIVHPDSTATRLEEEWDYSNTTMMPTCSLSLADYRPPKPKTKRNPVNGSHKQLSPKRVKARRQKAKAAKAARKRSR